MKKALIQGAGGFIGSHLVKRLKSEGYWVRGVDTKYPQFSETYSDEFLIADLRDPQVYDALYIVKNNFDEVYQLSGDMGGATYINSGQNDAEVMSNSALININTGKACLKHHVGKLFFASSACVYRNSDDPEAYVEEKVYPAQPDNEYGWEKLFSERMYLSYRRLHGLDVKIARFHSIVGPEGTWNGGKEKAHSALARKVAMVEENGTIDVIGDGQQARSFLYIDDCIDAVRTLMKSDVEEVVNIGSEEIVTINEYINLLKDISGKNFNIEYINGPIGVMGRSCPIDKIYTLLGWKPKTSLREATEITYRWIESQIEKVK